MHDNLPCSDIPIAVIAKEALEGHILYMMVVQAPPFLFTLHGPITSMLRQQSYHDFFKAR